MAAEDKSLAWICTEIIITQWLSHFISVCTAADARVLQLSVLFHKPGDHQGRNNCRKGHMLLSNASPVLCCSLNFIQTLTKCTYFSNSANELLLLGRKRAKVQRFNYLSFPYAFQLLQIGCLNTQTQYTTFGLLLLSAYQQYYSLLLLLASVLQQTHTAGTGRLFWKAWVFFH